MGWPGMVFLGAVIGFAGWWLHPSRRASRVWTAVGAGVIAAVVAKMLGSVVGIYHAGDTLEWLACALMALVATGVSVGLSARR
jgi:uncharacterized membrane protein YeaQ/YmgE (transglycosylase-associated protein family)